MNHGDLTEDIGAITLGEFLRIRYAPEAPRPERAVPATISRIRPPGRREWVRRAECARIPLDSAMAWFFPDQGDHAAAHAAAAAVCRRCPVIEECLEDALSDSHSSTGFRAGKSERERDRMRRQRRRNQQMRRTA